MQQTFYYLDALPGAGKTEYFVNLADRLLTRNLNHILIYVAPTRALVQETFRRLLARGLPTSKVFLAMDNVRTGVPKDLVDHGQWLRDLPSIALNRLLNLVTENDYQQAQYRGDYEKDCTRTLRPGDIVMTTHETLLRVRGIDTVNNDFRILKRCHVVFDEARNCVLESKAFALNPADWQSMLPSMTVKEVERTDTWSVAKITSIVPPAKLKENFKVPLLDRVPSEVLALKRMYDLYVKAGRASIYMLFNTKSAGIQDLMAPDQGSISVHMMLRPISLFQHYGKVTLVSAFLTDSQMYHFLKRDGHRFVDLLAKPLPKDHILYPVQVRSHMLRANVSRRLHVAPLLVPEVKASADILTSYQLASKFVVPADFEGTHTGRNPKDHSYIPEGYRVPPLWVLLRAAAKVFKVWQKKNLHAEHALLTLNVDSAHRKWMNRIRYLSVVKFIASYGFLYLLDPKDRGTVPLKEYQQAALAFTSDKWVNFFRLSMFGHSDRRVFTTPNSPSLYGLNTYSGYHAFVHLAALNPTQSLIQFYSVLLKDYDVHLDHSIDNLVQMLYRTNLRDPKGSKPVLLITAYQSVATMLAEKLGVPDFKIVHKPVLKAFAHKAQGTRQRHSEGSRKGGLNSRKYDQGKAPRIALLKSYIRRAERRGLTPRTTEAVAKWKSELLTLTKP